MKMNTLITGAVVALLAALPATAQEVRPFAVGGSIQFPGDNVKKLTHGNIGAGLTFSYETVIPRVAVPIRFGAGFNTLPGKEQDGVKTSLTNGQVYLDVLTAVGNGNLRLVTGLSLNKYSASITKPEGSADPILVDGVKMGARIGFDYIITPRLSAEVLYQQTELASSAKGGVNPGWVQVGARFHF